MTSTKVTNRRARARARDPRDAGPCLFPGCDSDVQAFYPVCRDHFKVIPDIFRIPLRESWRRKEEQRWLDAVDALRFYWLSVAP